MGFYRCKLDSTVYTEVISIALPEIGLHEFDDWLMCRACYPATSTIQTVFRSLCNKRS